MKINVNKLFTYYKSNDCQSHGKWAAFFFSNFPSPDLFSRALLHSKHTTESKTKQKKRRCKKIEKFWTIYWHHVECLTAPCGINRSRLHFLAGLSLFHRCTANRATNKSSLRKREPPAHIHIFLKSQTICLEFMELNNLKWQSHVNNGARH